MDTKQCLYVTIGVRSAHFSSKKATLLVETTSKKISTINVKIGRRLVNFSEYFPPQNLNSKLYNNTKFGYFRLVFDFSKNCAGPPNVGEVLLCHTKSWTEGTPVSQPTLCGGSDPHPPCMLYHQGVPIEVAINSETCTTGPLKSIFPEYGRLVLFIKTVAHINKEDPQSSSCV